MTGWPAGGAAVAEGAGDDPVAEGEASFTEADGDGSRPATGETAIGGVAVDGVDAVWAATWAEPTAAEGDDAP